MSKRIHEVVTDLCFMGILVLVFAGMVFLAIDHNHFAFNTVMLCIVIIIFMFVYYAGVKMGIILNMVFMFLFLAYTVVHSFQTGAAIGMNIYFWLLWPLLMSAAICGYVWQKQAIEKENVILQEKVDRFVTIDDVTQLNNLLAYERDARVYMNLSGRYKIPLVLLLWRLRAQGDLERLLSREEISEALSHISDAIKGSLRGEDLVYLVDKEPYIWAVLLFTDPKSTGIVQKRVADNVFKVGQEFYSDKEELSLELLNTATAYDGTAKTPLTFLAQAKEEMSGSGVRKRPSIFTEAIKKDGEPIPEAPNGEESTVEKRNPPVGQPVKPGNPSDMKLGVTGKANEGNLREDDFDFEVDESDDWDV